MPVLLVAFGLDIDIIGYVVYNMYGLDACCSRKK